jgi:hypothetical protein
MNHPSDITRTLATYVNITTYLDVIQNSVQCHLSLLTGFHPSRIVDRGADVAVHPIQNSNLLLVDRGTVRLLE